MPPSNTVDSSLDFGDPMFIGMQAVFATTVLLAFGRWAWLLVCGVVQRHLARKQAFELMALSIPLTVLAITIGYMVFVSSEAASWSR
jgi:hypothetical protein